MNYKIKKNEDFLIKTLESKTSYTWTREHKFLKERRFRFDFACIDLKIAIEVEGGIWSNGRHVRGAGYIRDMEKYNLATIYGWRLLRYKPDTYIADVLVQIGLLINNE